VRLDFREELGKDPSFSVLLDPCSLLVFQDDAYTKYFHGIEESDTIKMNDNTYISTSHETNEEGRNEIIRETRVSLTVRIVP